MLRIFSVVVYDTELILRKILCILTVYSLACILGCVYLYTCTGTSVTLTDESAVSYFPNALPRAASPR